VDNGVVWKAGGAFYFTVPVSIPANTTVTISYEGSNSAGESMHQWQFLYTDGTYTNGAQYISGKCRTAEKEVKGIYLYKYSAATALTQDLLVSNIQIEVGETATDYEAYKAPQTATADENGNVAGLTSVAPTMTIISDSPVECVYLPECDCCNKYMELKAAEIALKEELAK
jgi:hypothetical protein